MRPQAKSPTTPKPDTSNYKERVAALQQQRDRLMAEIGLLTKTRVGADSFVRKALTLLTVGWGKASWRARADLLRSADWLLNMERTRRAKPVAAHGVKALYSSPQRVFQKA